MKKLFVILLVTVVFSSGYLLGQLGTPVFPVKNAEAVQGPIPINCKVTVDTIRCYKETFNNVAHVTISLSEGEFKDPQSLRSWGTSTSKTIELTYK